MAQEFDLYMISIEWSKPNQYSKILRGQRPFKPNIVGNIEEYDVVMYTKENGNYFQIAIETDLTPYIETINNHGQKHHEKFYEIDKGLWIIKEEWRNGFKGGYHYCPSINTKGIIEVVLSPDGKKIANRIKIDINLNIEGFDFEALKDDFEGELWSLLTSNNSKVKIEKSEIRFGDKNFRFAESQLIINFICEFEKIAKNPKKELKYATNNQPFEKVKPISATFKTLAVKGTDTLLPSKTFVEDFDNYENRYLCFMLYKIYQIVQHTSQFLFQQENKRNSEIERIKAKIAELQNPQFVNEEQVLMELHLQEQKIIHSENKWKAINSGLNWDKTGIYTVKSVNLWRRHHLDLNTFWCYTPDFCLITFPDIIAPYLKEGASFKIEMLSLCKRWDNTKRGQPYQIFYSTEIKSIESIEVALERNILKKQKQNYETFKMNKWVKILTAQESTERDNQVKTLQKRILKLESFAKSMNDFSDEVQKFKQPLAKLLNSDFVKKITLKKGFRFQPSMTFIQNIQYKNALKYYQEILISEGIDVSVFGLYEKIASYGVREMPQVFELWSLVSIVKILEETFSYKHNPSDFQKLLDCISMQNRKKDNYIKIDFSGLSNERSVTLHYQQSLSNGKRPDFILEVNCQGRKIFVILDAKFKNYEYKKGAENDLKEMKEKYLIGDNFFVFTIHPCKDYRNDKGLVKMTNYGGHQIYFSENNPILPFHKFGFITLKPNETDNLKKVIGMALEYLIESKHILSKENGIIDANPEFSMICLSCGGEKVKHHLLPRGTPPYAYHYKFECENEDCGHNIYIDYCWNCKTKLFKHGSYWDYHRTSVWSIFDIHCPNCGMTVADKP